MDDGYDSEPVLAMGPNGDYFLPQDEKELGSTYQNGLAQRAEKQLTPSSEDGAEHSYRVARPPMSHSGSARKPLPALPEDPD